MTPDNNPGGMMPDREAMARTIYPEAFADETPHDNVVYRNMAYHEARADAFAKADAILALFPSPQSAPNAFQGKEHIDLEALDRWRGIAEETHGHDMCGVNANTLRRLIRTIDTLRTSYTPKASPPADMVMDEERAFRAGWEACERGERDQLSDYDADEAWEEYVAAGGRS